MASMNLSLGFLGGFNTDTYIGRMVLKVLDDRKR